MDDRFLRTKMLIGDYNFKKLSNSKVMVFGIGGVGGYVAEGLARSGVGHIILIDNDKVDRTNINRQIIALNSTVGKNKTDVMEERIKDINPNAVVEKHNIFFLAKNSDIIKPNIDYIVDAVDTISAKIEIIVKANEFKIPVISSMGTGKKMSPELLEIDDIYNTSKCPLAKVMRHELRKRGIKSLKVVYSKEEPLNGYFDIEQYKKTIPSCMFVPAAAGIIISSAVVRDLITKEVNNG